jgi:hypothetical protein
MSVDLETLEPTYVGHVNHVCFAYASAESQENARREFSQLLEIDDWDEMTTDPGRKLRVFISWKSGIELIAAMGPGSLIDEHLAKHGEGFYSLSVGVADLDASMARINALGRETRRTGGHPDQKQRWEVAEQASIIGPVGGIKLIVGEHRGYKPKS